MVLPAEYIWENLDIWILLTEWQPQSDCISSHPTDDWECSPQTLTSSWAVLPPHPLVYWPISWFIALPPLGEAVRCMLHRTQCLRRQDYFNTLWYHPLSFKRSFILVASTSNSRRNEENLWLHVVTKGIIFNICGLYHQCIKQKREITQPLSALKGQKMVELPLHWEITSGLKKEWERHIWKFGRQLGVRNLTI